MGSLLLTANETIRYNRHNISFLIQNLNVYISLLVTSVVLLRNYDNLGGRIIDGYTSQTHTQFLS